MCSSWTPGKPTQLDPPRYDQTIVLCQDKDTDAMWLWIQNYEGVLFADGLPDAIISLKIGLGIFERRPREPPDSNTCNTWSISEWLDVPEIIKFQQTILVNRNQPPQQTSAKLYALGLIFAPLKEICEEIGVPLTDKPTEKTQPQTFIHQYIAGYTTKKYPRSVWKVESSKKGERKWTYEGEGDSLLSPAQYKKYEKDDTEQPGVTVPGFIGYFPKPSFVLQEQQTELIDRTCGVTLNFDPRTIKPVCWRFLESVPSELETRIPPEILAQMDARIRKEESEAPAPSGSPNISGATPPGTPHSDPDATAPKTLHSELVRIDCYAFRGDTRDPIAIRAATGFFCNVTRRGVEKVKEKAALVDKTLAKSTAETLVEVLIELGALHLGRYTEDQSFGGFVSTTTSVAIAKCFTNSWHQGLPKDAEDDGKGFVSRPAPKFNSQNFCYALRSRGLVLPSNKETRHLRQQVHKFANFAEQEVAVPGLIEWGEVFGFRMCRSRGQGPVFAGPVWIRRTMLGVDPRGFEGLFALLSGETQGEHPAIQASYPTPPWGPRPSTLPTKSDLQSAQAGHR